MEIAVVGSELFGLGFKLVGIRRIVEAEPREVESKINQVLEDTSIGILVLDMRDVERLSPAMKKRLDNVPKPVVIAVGRREEEDLRSKIKRAIGIDLYKT